ncbi:MAG: hypothetical protein ABJB34_06280, partial [Acidobacteriota bacterium]
DQLEDLQTEKRRLLLAREVASSPLSIRKAASAMGLRERADLAAVQISDVKSVVKNSRAPADSGEHLAVAAKVLDNSIKVVRTVLTTPVVPKPTGETRSRVVEPSKFKKDKTEVAVLLKLR